MNKITNKFLKLFFNPEEEICFSSNKYATSSQSQKEIQENNTILVAINPIKGQRNDENVTAYRTFMIECDDGPIKDQWDYIKSTGFPFSYCCFSGNKSLHFALVLNEDIPSDFVYRYTYQWILNILSKADQKTKNPSRSIRFPGVIRSDTGKQQGLIFMGERISPDDLNVWLNKHQEKQPVTSVSRKKERSEVPDFEGIKAWVSNALDAGIHNMEGSRNQRWMSIGCELALNGYSLDETLEYLEHFFQEQSDFTHREWSTAVKSGWKYADKIAR